MLLSSKVVKLDFAANDQTDALSSLADALFAAGMVTDEYKEAILQREANFPTGLATATYGVAIPHCDADKVLEPQVGFMRLDHPVTFHQMGDNTEIQVEFIIMLALKKSEDQLTMLQKLMELFQNQAAMDRLKDARDADDVVAVLTENGVQ